MMHYIGFVHKCTFGFAALRKSTGHELALKCPNAKFFTSEPENWMSHILEFLNLSDCNSCVFGLGSQKDVIGTHHDLSKHVRLEACEENKFPIYSKIIKVQFVLFVTSCKQESSESSLTQRSPVIRPQGLHWWEFSGIQANWIMLSLGSRDSSWVLCTAVRAGTWYL
jgi:hypothetical protein